MSKKGGDFKKAGCEAMEGNRGLLLCSGIKREVFGMSVAESLMGVEEFIALPMDVRGDRAQFIDGQIVQKTLPSGEHSSAQSEFLRTLLPKFSRKKRGDGSGGWWIRTEVSILLPTVAQVLTPDIVGWKRDRLESAPKGFPVRELPDWICEVSVATLRNDSRDKLRVFEVERIPFYWVIDVMNDRLIVFEEIDGHLVQTRELYKDDGLQRLPPFDGVDLSMAVLFGEEES